MPATTVTRATPHPRIPPGAWRATAHAAVSGVTAVVAGLAVPVLCALVAWVGDSRDEVPARAAVGVGVDAWGMAHGGLVQAGGLTVRFVPLGISFLLVWLVRALVRRVLRSHRLGPAGVSAVVASSAAAYAVSGAVLLKYLTGYADVDVLSAVPGLLAVPVLGGGWAGVRAAEASWLPLWRRLPLLVRRGVHAARPGGLALLLSTTALLLWGLVSALTQMLEIHTALRPGVAGSLVLGLAQLAAAVNLLVGVLGFSTGAGVHVGGVTAGMAGTSGGSLPAVPVLAVLPEPGTGPWWLWLALAVPVGTGAYVGWRTARAWSGVATWRQVLGSTAVAVGAIVLMTTAVAGVSGGSVTPGQLTALGPDPLRLAGLLTLELGGAAALTAGLTWWFRRP